MQTRRWDFEASGVFDCAAFFALNYRPFGQRLGPKSPSNSNDARTGAYTYGEMKYVKPRYHSFVSE
jgi:hypothetical protein